MAAAAASGQHLNINLHSGRTRDDANMYAAAEFIVLLLRSFVPLLLRKFCVCRLNNAAINDIAAATAAEV